MTLTRRRFLAVAAAATAMPGAALATAPSWSGIALGADATITLSGPSERTAPALDEAITTLRRIERMFSLFDPGSDLVRLNTAGHLDGPAEDWAAVLHVVDAVHHATEGRFDPTVQPLWRALADGHDTTTARAAIGWNRVVHDRKRVRLGAGQALTLNGIAQGYATDAVRAVLRRHGFGRSLVNIGEFAGDGGPWRLGVADPALGITLNRTITDRTIATSSPTAMRLGAQGHILSPAGHAPVWSTVSVEATDATLADAASTALCLADQSAMVRIKRALPGLLRITAIDARGNIATI